MSSPIVFQADIKSFKEIDKKLKKLPANVHRNASRRAMRKALTMLKKEAKQNAPIRSGQLKKSLMTKVRLWGNGELTGMVFAKGGKQKRSAPHAHLVEWGYKHTSGVQVSGSRFMTRTFEAHKSEVIHKFKIELLKEIEKLSK